MSALTFFLRALTLIALCISAGIMLAASNYSSRMTVRVLGLIGAIVAVALDATLFAVWVIG